MEGHMQEEPKKETANDNHDEDVLKKALEALKRSFAAIERMKKREEQK